MDITRRCDYALRILRAAYQRSNSLVSVSEVAELEDIPYAFARSIQHDLVKADMLRTTRGAGGGFTLACDPHKVTISDIIEALEGPITIAPCASNADACDKRVSCQYNKLWQGADALLKNYFSAVTLANILEDGEDHPAIKQAYALQF